MGRIIIAVLWLTAIILSLCFVYFITCRLRMLSKILSLRKISGVSLKIEYFPALLLPFVTRKPFATARVGGKAYPIRIFSGINGFKAVHIANERYAAIYTRTGGEGLRHTGGRFKLLRRVREPFKIFGARVRVIPPLELDMPRASEADASFSYFTEAREPQEKIIPALIFCPEPRELSYVTKERCSIKLAFMGDEVIGHRVFTPDTFESYIDRDSRGFYDNLRKAERED